MPGLFVGADHRGLKAKQELLAALAREENFPYEIFDLGAYTYLPEDDYNDVTITVARSVLRNPESFGVIFCGSGVGVSIQANRMKGIRAVVGTTPEIIHSSRDHNDANVLCLSADNMTSDEITTAVKSFISTKFSAAARHARRNHRLDENIPL